MSETTATAAPARRPARGGRPRDPSKDPLILGTAVELLGDVGIGGFVADELAARCRVGKATIYRRWRSLDALLADVIRDLGVRDVLWARTGSLAADLCTLARVTTTGPGARAERAVLSWLPYRPALREAYIEGPERRLNDCIDAARERADARGDAWPDELLIHACIRQLHHDALDTDTDPDALVIADRVASIALAGLPLGSPA